MSCEITHNVRKAFALSQSASSRRLTEPLLFCSVLCRTVLCRPVPCMQVLVFCEICHNVRKSFALSQLAQVVSFMACTIADRAQMYNNQSTCVRLSLNLVECLYQVAADGMCGLGLC